MNEKNCYGCYNHYRLVYGKNADNFLMEIEVNGEYVWICPDCNATFEQDESMVHPI